MAQMGTRIGDDGMNSVLIQMTAEDAERLAVTSMAWGNDWASHDGRFESVRVKGAVPSYRWGRAYWLESGAAAYILFTSYLTANGFDHEVLWDLVDDCGYVVLTDWQGE
jgi:hypothetical protein